MLEFGELCFLYFLLDLFELCELKRDTYFTRLVYSESVSSEVLNPESFYGDKTFLLLF